MKILVLGGTRYFGRHLIESLLAKGHDVTVATRGNNEIPFSSKVQFVKSDRKNQDDLKKLAELGPFDILYDQICMSGMDAHIAVLAFRDQCKRYIFTSTGSVYDFQNDHALVESDFNPKNYKINLGATQPTDYQEDKRQAEAVFSEQSNFPVAMVRFPIVLGEDDYTARLKFHISRIINNEEIYFPRLETQMAFIRSDEAGEFLSFLGEQSFTGPVNAASNGAIALGELVGLIELANNKKAKLVDTKTALNASPFGSEVDFVMSNKLANELGFKFLNLREYLGRLVVLS
ncbi:MAG: NAD-dependent epimerase/dehydratase family protein [Bacteriovorax sp.]|nr:NAD-dependent epimerase/dehydratase family protein [Bacteriovorax sp.]